MEIKLIDLLIPSSVFYVIQFFHKVLYDTFHWNVINPVLCYNFFFQVRNLLDASSMAARGGSQTAVIERSTAMFILRTSLTIVESWDVISLIPILVRYAST